MAKEMIRVERGEFKITDNPNQSLYTEGLDSCLGLTLIENKGEKRGLAHVYYDGKNNFNLKSQDSFLNDFLSNFSNPNAYLTYIGHKFNGNSRYENLMANYVQILLGNRKIKVISDGLIEFERRYIFCKEMAVHNNKLYILYRDINKNLMNHPCQEIFF